MAETPKEVQLDVTYSPSMRAVVRAVLVQVQNKLLHLPKSDTEDGMLGRAVGVVNSELENWLGTPTDPEDTLPQWLWKRYSKQSAVDAGLEFSRLAPETQSYWEHEAAAVRRAVGRGGVHHSASYDPSKSSVEMPEEGWKVGPGKVMEAPSVSNPQRNDDGSFTIYDSRISKPPYNTDVAKCWCGSKVGPRIPGDNWGNGCLANITHQDWTQENRPAARTPGYDGPEGTEWDRPRGGTL